MKSDRKIFNFNTFKSSLEFASSICNGKVLLDEAKNSQYEIFKQLKELEQYDLKNLDKINSRKETLINAEKLYNKTNNVVKASENAVFLFKDGW